MNLKFVKFLDFVIFFFFFFIEYCKNREKKMILLMFKWKFFVFFLDYGIYGCDIIYF